MTSADSSEETPSPLRVYSVRISVQASQDIIDSMFYLVETTGEVARAQSWKNELYEEIGTLATLPRRYPIRERETRLFGQPMRILVFRHSSTMFAHLVLYSLNEAGVDGPIVTILHVRHGSRKSPTRAEARQILGNL